MSNPAASRLYLAPPGATDLLRTERSGEGWAEPRPVAPGHWPLPRPGTEQVLVSRLDVDPPASSIALADASGALPEQAIFASRPGDPPVISAGVPHYCCWSPAGRYLAYGVASPDGFELYVTMPGTDGATNLAAKGAPIFFAWHPGEQLLAVHVGGRLELIDPPTGETIRVVAEDAAGFRAPVFSGDGAHLVFARSDGSNVTLHDCDPRTHAVADLGPLPGGTALAFRPATSELYASVTRQPDTGTFDQVRRLDLAGDGEPAILDRGPFVGLFWSPAGDRLVTVVPAQSGDSRYLLRAHDPTMRPLAWSPQFVPSDEYRTALSFFDQYALSHPFWSGDGAHFGLGGRLAEEGAHSAFGDVPSRVFTWTGRAGQPLEHAGPGVVGIFAS